MSQLVEYLYPALPLRRTALAVVGWWESRRLVYNLVVGATGLLTLAVGTLTLMLPPSEGVQLPPWQAIVAYGVMANFAYTLGPVVELALRRICGDELRPVGPLLFRQGLAFSVGLTLIPAIAMVAFWLVRVALAIVG